LSLWRRRFHRPAYRDISTGNPDRDAGIIRRPHRMGEMSGQTCPDKDGNISVAGGHWSMHPWVSHKWDQCPRPVLLDFSAHVPDFGNGACVANRCGDLLGALEIESGGQAILSAASALNLHPCALSVILHKCVRSPEWTHHEHHGSWARWTGEEIPRKSSFS